MRMVLTGTCAYGPFGNDSDIDIAIHKMEVDGIVKALKSLGIKVRNHKHINPVYDGIWFKACGRIIQMIVLSTNAELDAWEKATEKMKEYKSFTDRDRRVKIFQKFYQRFLEQGDFQPSALMKITDNKPTYDYDQDEIPSVDDDYLEDREEYEPPPLSAWDPEDDDIAF